MLFAEIYGYLLPYMKASGLLRWCLPFDNVWLNRASRESPPNGDTASFFICLKNDGVKMARGYRKAFLSLQQQVQKLADNGLEIPDRREAEAILGRYGYYRLSGYWFILRQLDNPDQDIYTQPDGAVKHLEKRKSEFVPGSSLEHVCKIYDFDMKLRKIVLTAVESVEIALRFHIGHVLGRSTPYGHRDPRYLRSEFSGFDDSMPELKYSHWVMSSHAEITAAMDHEEKRSSETFVDHFKYKYGGPLPIWAATEIMSFGTLTRLYVGLQQKDQDRIAGSFGVLTANSRGDGGLFSNWLNHLRYVRNICAHYARLWNKNMTVQLADTSQITELAHLHTSLHLKRVYGTLTVLGFLTTQIDIRSQWRFELRALLNEHVIGWGLNLQQMGFPDDWQEQDIWKQDYEPLQHDRAQKQHMVEELDCMAPSDAGEWLAPDRTPKKRLDYLRYLRNKGKLIGLNEAGTHYYPRFQFAQGENALRQEVADRNEEIFNSIKDHKGDEELPWKMAEYWLEIPTGKSLGNRISILLNEESK